MVSFLYKLLIIIEEEENNSIILGNLKDLLNYIPIIRNYSMFLDKWPTLNHHYLTNSSTLYHKFNPMHFGHSSTLSTTATTREFFRDNQI